MNFQKENLDKVSFFRKDKVIYYQFNNQIYEYNNTNMHELNEILMPPFKAEIINLSRFETEKILAELCNGTFNSDINKMVKNKDELFTTEATFFKVKKYVEAYKVPDNTFPYKIRSEIKYFLYTKKKYRNFLIEISKDLASTCFDRAYILASDLTNEEKELFKSLYIVLECDYINRIKKEPKKKLR